MTFNNANDTKNDIYMLTITSGFEMGLDFRIKLEYLIRNTKMNIKIVKIKLGIVEESRASGPACA